MDNEMINEFDEEFGDGTDNIETDLMDIRESARINGIIEKLKLYDSNPQVLTELYTQILLDDNVAFMLVKVSQNPIFMKHFPEFYEKNEYGENVINCQQNSTYHKYGVFRHILTTIENVGNPQIPIGDWQKKILKWTMLLHDIGKPYVKVVSDDGRESFAGHDDKSVELAVGILDRFVFSPEEKHIILTLIKYHDKFLNDGELTYDNLKFLANELDNNKELFYMLIDVKDSDARAKSVDVYNRYKLAKNKYIEFINTYFTYGKNGEISVSKDNTENNVAPEAIVPLTEAMSRLEIETLVNDVIDRKKVTAMYQPVVDLKNKMVHGYEVFTRIQSDKRIDVVEFLNYTKELNKYDKVQQVLLINGIDNFEHVKNREADTLFVNTDLRSYDKYINKPRLYDMMARNKIVIEFHNYEKKDLTGMQEMFALIHKNRGLIALDNFGVGSLTIDDINLLDIDYIIPDMSLIRNIDQDVEKQKYLSDVVTFALSKEINVVAVGIESKEVLETLQRIGVKYGQGYYFSKPQPAINMENEKIREKLSSHSDDTITP